MSDLRPRVLMWHRVLAQMTGTLSLTYGANGLKKGALAEWIRNLHDIAGDMQAVMDGASSGLDDKTRTMLKSAAKTAPLGDPDSPEDTRFFGKTERKNEVTTNTRAGPEVGRPAKTGTGKVAPKPLRTATRKAGVK